ncbi:Down syndrome cell adhesion molecule-like protein Dscam2 [Centruroides sculpturatus]|uniref:Down syndrome cell adhesion molecule-like protein Dscam2 n=1 Tax=Centruroides sculpturatus TaxID=218467 RepID=UPI000C6CF9C8|nr:Down syndrome cell adhesion molecule-like protein Dscam2 [Centruroides sculpturatus]
MYVFGTFIYLLLNVSWLFFQIVNSEVVSPEIKPFYFSTSIQEGKRQQITCSIEAGDPPLHFIWKKDGSDVSRETLIKYDDLYSILIIPSVQSKDIGNYTCIVKNAAGSDSYTASLIMKVLKYTNVVLQCFISRKPLQFASG